MSSAVNIQIVSMPNLAKIESFLKDVSYRETIEYSANFNTRLCIERRLRLPFLDPQTGVAQSHSQLFLDKRQRMPGFRQGQIYTYPAARWRKSRRQYLSKMYSRFPERPFQALRKEHEALVASGVNLGLSNLTSVGGASIPNINSNSLGMSSSLTLNMLTGGGAAPAVLHSDTAHDFNGAFSLEESSSLGAAGGDTSDSKDSQQQQQQHHHHQQAQQQQTVKEEHLPKEWFYDDMDMNDVDSLEEPKSPADDEYDYDPRYGNKKRRKRRPGKRGGDSGGGGGGAGGGGGGGGAGGGGGSSAGGSSSRRRSAAARSRITTTDAALDASLEAIESGESVPPGSNGASLTGGGILSGSSLGAGASGSSGSGVGGGAGGGGAVGGAGAGAGGGGSAGSSASSRRSRGAGTRGRRRAKGAAGGDPPSPGMVIEPPSFESAAAAVGVVEDANAHLRNYRKYL